MAQQEICSRTLKLNNKQKLVSRQARLQALDWLKNTYPQAFDTSNSIRPLEKGIMKKILANASLAEKDGISKSKLREAVVVFTRSIAYLTCLKAKEMRIDLEGNAVVLVTDEEAENAALKIQKRVENSAKIAKSSLFEKMQSADFPPIYPSPSPERIMPAYTDRPNAFNAQRAKLVTTTNTVVVKHKASRSFDPNAVLKLKEKLGLKSQTQSKEAIES